MGKPQLDSTQVTLLTLGAAFTGLLTVIVSWPFVLLLIPILLAPRYIYLPAVHSWTKTAQFTLTTFAFGIIDAFCLADIFAFLLSDWEGAVPTMQTYLFILTVYHYFEFQLVNNFHFPQLVWNSFLIYHSKFYFLATCGMASEHIILKYLVGVGYKDRHPLILPGLVLAVLGQGLRITAFFTCKSNFTHIVKYQKSKTHTLVTNGVYSFFRHPSYTGYFYFSVGGQLMIGNFLSAIAFFAALSLFFHRRIDDQQKALVVFFPQYLSYSKSTYVLIPFVRPPDLQNYEPAYFYGSESD